VRQAEGREPHVVRAVPEDHDESLIRYASRIKLARLVGMLTSIRVAKYTKAEIKDPSPTRRAVAPT